MFMKVADEIKNWLFKVLIVAFTLSHFYNASQSFRKISVLVLRTGIRIIYLSILLSLFF